MLMPLRLVCEYKKECEYLDVISRNHRSSVNGIRKTFFVYCNPPFFVVFYFFSLFKSFDSNPLSPPFFFSTSSFFIYGISRLRP
jgi:hypothetical protein